MTNDTNIDLSRRKVLGSLGAIGVASAGAGFGTSAYFNDEESFDDNTLTAGDLDLKVDWEEHYYDGSQDVSNIDVQLVTDGVDDGYVGFPSQDPTVQVASEDVAAFMDATAIEAFPDPNNDGIQDSFASAPGQTTDDGVGYICEDGADTPEDLDPSGLRTDNDDTHMLDPEKDEIVPAPLINLHDVKPGDFGELTLSTHLCSNPGYVWIQGALADAWENGQTEPERKANGENSGTVELLDEIQTTLWYDDGNNILDSDGEADDDQPVDVVITLDRSGSMTFEPGKFQSAKDGAKALVDALGSNAKIGLVSFSSSPTLDVGLTFDKQSVKDSIDALTSDGGTDLSAAIDGGREELTGNDVSSITASGGDRDNAKKIQVFLTNGQDFDEQGTRDAADAMKSEGDLYTIAYGSDADTQLLEDLASDPASDYFFNAPSQSEVQNAFEDIGEAITTAGEEIIFEGSLRDTLDELAQGNGIPLDADPDSDERAPFEESNTYYVGLEWRLPTSVGNEVQTDSVSFDLGFYAEQARHNDGSGQAAD